MDEWMHKAFVEESELFLRVMNAHWKTAEQEATDIAAILGEHGIVDGTILDLMCGNGRIAIHLAKQGYNVVGVDISPTYINDAKEKAKEYDVENLTEFMRGDVRHLQNIFPTEWNFDAVVNVWTSLGYFEKHVERSFFKTLRNYVSEKGLLVIANAPSKEWWVSEDNRFRNTSFESFDDMVLMEQNTYKPCSSKLEMKWAFYQKEEELLFHISTIPMSLHLYSLEGIHSLLKKAGWEILEFYESLDDRTAYEPEEIPKPIPINLIAKKREHSDKKTKKTKEKKTS